MLPRAACSANQTNSTYTSTHRYQQVHINKRASTGHLRCTSTSRYPCNPSSRGRARSAGLLRSHTYRCLLTHVTAKAVGPEGKVSQDHITLTPRRPKPKGLEGGNTLTNGQRPRQRWLCARHQAELAKCPYVGRSALSYMRAAKWTWDAVSWRPTRNQRMATTAASAAVC